MTEARPHVSINMAMTLDGKVMRPDGRWYGLSSPADRARMDVYRAQADALIVGRNSIDRDDPVVKPRTDGPHPVPVLVCRTALPPHNRRIFQDEAHRALVFTTEQLAGYGRATGLYG
ncbi:MAG: dihydrofolate reductase family protein, partial [Spirochaetia bacterium]|nr:dihydrofolate reductase family protein [Spirochaetia bacterium]